MSLSEELHLRRPFTSVEEEALLSILATYDLLNRGFAHALRGHGLTTAQYNVMRILRGAGEEGLPLMTIARRMIVRYPNVTRLTDRLEAEGLIRRVRCTEDRRVVRGFITKDGLGILSQLDEEMRELNLHLMRGAKTPELRRLISILEDVRKPLQSGDGKIPANQNFNGNGRPSGS